MEPIDYVRALSQRWITILLLLVLGAAAGYGYANLQPDQYRATSSVFVTANTADNTQALFQGNQFSQNVVQSYVQLATMPTVLEPVIERLGLKSSPAQLARQISASAQLDTVIISITATAQDPQQAANIAQATAEELKTQADGLAPKTSKESAVSIKVVEKAITPTSPVGPNRTMLVAIGAVLGLALGVVYAIGRQLLDTRVAGEEGVRRVTTLPLLGRVARYRNRGGAVLRTSPNGLAAEEYRRLRTNLEFANVDAPVSVVVVSSAHPGEGKSTTALNLALAVAEQGKRTLLIDGDLRKPTVAAYTGLDGSIGVTSVLRGASSLEDATQAWEGTGLDVLPSGVVPPNPNQLVESAAMSRLVTEARERYDFVVIDAPPLLAVTDTLALTALTDGAVVVTLNGSTKRADLARALEGLELVNATTLGIVLNQAESLSKSAYYSYDASTQPKPSRKEKRVEARGALTGATR